MHIIRKCTKEDLQDIYNLVKALAVFEKEPDAVKAQPEEYHKAYDQKLIDAIVAEFEGQIIGMVFYYPVFSSWNGRTMYLEDFIVKDEYRNRGIGQELFDAFISEARAQQCRQVKWQVLDWNEEAIRFYKRNGASIEKNWWNGRMKLKLD
ncbi:MAG: GNAT family N-acetyltransferase [Saprospiraceae bacterium]|nr:GNAT family N-acetyltransferase [Saprospiraceae bacterium]